MKSWRATSNLLPLQTGKAGAANDPAVGGARDILESPGHPLDDTTRCFMEGRFEQDFSGVRLHSDAVAGAAASGMGAVAWTHGHDIAFAPDAYEPHTPRGRDLLAHELAHVVQQTRGGGGMAGAAHEAEADLAASAVLAGHAPPLLSPVAPTVQRRVEFRDVGRGEHSGFDRLPDIIARLNAISAALIFSVDEEGILSCIGNPDATMTEFDRRMRGFVESGTRIPLRLTNRHGLMRNGAGRPFNIPVGADEWGTGYVDVDDMLGSDDLAFQTVLIHFLTERATTNAYARRMGTLNALTPEFDRAHDRGIQGEVAILRDFFRDPGIRVLNREGSGRVLRSFRTTRGDTIRTRTPVTTSASGALDLFIDVRLRDGTIMSANDYKALLERERAAAEAASEQAARVRLLEQRGAPQTGPAE